MYDSPITLIASELQIKMENDTLQAVQRYGIDVDKDELKKALEYDRGQYDKGFADGVLHGERLYVPTGKWIAREDMDYLDKNKAVHNHFECNKCGLIHDFIDGHTSQYNFCPNCGARMKRGENSDV